MGRPGDHSVARVEAAGLRAASIIDLIAVGFSRTKKDAILGEQMARSFLQRFSKIESLSDASFDDLRNITGLDEYELLKARALIEIGRRVGGAGKGEIPEVLMAADVYGLLDYLCHEKREHFVAILLDAKGGLMRIATIHVGTLNMSIVGAREVFREAIRDGASSLIVAHNHPSGDSTPSPEDIEVTKKLMEVGEMLDIPVLDHVIIGYRRYTSLRERNLI